MLVVALLLQAVPATGLWAEDALGRYRREFSGEAIDGAATARGCRPSGIGAEIVVCGKRDTERDRLPLRDERFAAGEAVSHPSEAASAAAGLNGSPQEPSRLLDTIIKALRAAKGAVTGEDPGY